MLGQRFARSAQGLQHLQVGLRRVVAAGQARADALGQHRWLGLAVQDVPRQLHFVGQLGETAALVAAQEGGVHDGREARGQRVARQLGQAFVGAARRFGAVERRVARVVERLQAVEPLALDVRAQPDSARRLGQLQRDGTLARPGQAVHEQEARGDALGAELRREFAVGKRRGRAGHGALALADQADLRAHQRAVDQRKAPQRQARVVARGVEPGVDEAKRQVAAAVRQQVHGNERGVVGDVDPAQRGVELDGIERGRLVVEQQQIAQVQVAMAFAHASRGLATGPGRRQHGGLVHQPVAQQRPLFCARRQQGRHRVAGCECCRSAPRRAAEIARGCGPRRRRMKARQAQREPVDVGADQGARGRMLGQQRARRKAPHAHRIVDGGAVAVDVRRLGRAGDAAHAEIERTREPAVESQLFFAEMAARRERAEVEKRQHDRLLQFVGGGGR